MLDKKESIIYDYVKAQYETEKQISQTIDSRIGNYLLITGLFWGILIQSTPGFIALNKHIYSPCNAIINIAWLCFLFGNVYVLIAIMWILYLFTKMAFSVPGVSKVEKYLEIIESPLTDSKDVIKEAIGNYVTAYDENVGRAAERSSHGQTIRIFIFAGIIFTVLFVFIYGSLKLNNGGNLMADKPIPTQSSSDKPVKPSMTQKPDHITLGNDKSKPTKPSMTQKPITFNIGENKSKK